MNATESIPSPITDMVKTREPVEIIGSNLVEAHARDGDHHLVESVDERPAHAHVARDAVGRHDLDRGQAVHDSPNRLSSQETEDDRLLVDCRHDI